MKEKTKRAFLQKLESVAENASKNVNIRHGFTVRDGITFSLGNSLDDVEKLLGMILEVPEAKTKYSLSTLRTRLDDFFALWIKTRDKKQLESALDSLIQEVGNFSTEHTVYLPLEGIRLSNPVEIGVVRLLPLNYWRGLSEVVAAQELPGVDLDCGSNVATIAEFKVIAEPVRARERAMEEVGLAVDVVRYCIPVKHGITHRAKVGFEGQVHGALRNAFVFRSNGISNSSSSVVGALYPFDFDRLSAEQLDLLGIPSLSEALKKDSPTSYEELIFKCLFWFSSADRQDDTHNKFLNLMTAIESVFNWRSDEISISDKVAWGLCIVLEVTKENEKSFIRDIKKLYGQRSGISHGGKTQVNATHLESLYFKTFLLLVRLLEKIKTFSSQEEFWKYVIESRTERRAQRPWWEKAWERIVAAYYVLRYGPK